MKYRAVVGTHLHVVLFVVLLLLFPRFSTGLLSNYLVSVDSPTKENLCSFMFSLYRDFSEFGCCIESPVAEPDVCYTSSNLLAEYILRNICGRSDLADKVKAFLNKYSTDFYDYHQVLILKPFTLPFTVVEHIQVDTVNGVRIVHVKRTNVMIKNYYNYANLLSLKAIHDIVSGHINLAVEELTKLNTLFDGRGFADAYYEKHGKYETYKIALAIILHRALNRTNEVEKYTNILFKIKPFTTLYEPGFNGVGDLNLETAALSAMALYSTIYHDILLKTAPSEREGYISSITRIMYCIVSIAVIALLLRLIVKIKTRSRGALRCTSGKVGIY